MLQTLLFLLIVASWLYWLVACFLVYYFFRIESRPDSLPGGGEDAGFIPPVSVLKPVRGVDWQAYQNFASFCRQDYPTYELLFAVADPQDPVIPLIERLQREFPQRSIRLIVAEAFGANRKASLLHHLVNEARYEILVVNDSDMRVTPDYLRRVVAPLSDDRIGLVTCPYRGELALTFTARLEALHMGAVFLPSVIVARKFLNMRFAMGATMALRRSDLNRLGGFVTVADYLADDYQLGARVAALGLVVHLSDYVIACVLGATTFREEWDREVRLARCNRVCRPVEYPGMLLTFSTPLAAVLLVVSSFAPLGVQMLAISLLLRWAVAWFVSGCTGDQEVRRWLVWLPVRDMLSALVWCVGGLGRRVIWRGEEFVLQADGRMEPAAPLPRPPVEEKHVWRF
jgi:ceramide glucosyltransferase